VRARISAVVAGSWHVLLPVKHAAGAKSRLGPPGAGRSALARAFALDCLTAVLATRQVAGAVVVTDDGTVSAEARRRGARVQPERRPGAGLLAAVRDGVSTMPPGPLAVLLADVPSLVPQELSAALEAVEAVQAAGVASAFVPDADGVGTVLLAATDASRLRPAFGPRSAAAHERAGAHRLDLDLPRLRRDVDTPEALAAALGLGVGAWTTNALAVAAAR
jgi:2-phospho-L-lactate guanylyltransferase